jgi:pimeloyl-ACP methyl ester carboxylesterase
MKLPLVLLSGLLSNDTLWRHQIEHLSDIAEVQVISTSQSTPEAMVQEILNKAPKKFALAGHSMGGWLCLEVMKTAPERVTKLCLINTTARMDSSEKRERRLQMIHEPFEVVVHQLVNAFTYNKGSKPIVEKMFYEVGREGFIRQEHAMLIRRETDLRDIHCPTLVIHAAQDKIFSLQEHEELVLRSWLKY